MNNFLFNFSSSYSGGGLKRLIAYLEWFDNNGGAHFIVNPRIKKLLLGSNNIFYYANTSKIQKALNSQNYLVDIVRQIDADIDLYYSYGIPLPYKVGRVNWFHLSNVLPLIDHSGYGLPLLRSIELKWLGILISKNYKNAEVLSAESSYSLSLFPLNLHHDLVVSPNGSDEEIKLFERSMGCKVIDIAVIVGTFFYKDLYSSYNIFLELQAKNSKLRLIIIGDKSMIPQKIKNDQCIDAMGEVSHSEVITLLSSAKFYINTSKVENSWNAASEGILLAEESFISDIRPHGELLGIIAGKKYKHDCGVYHIKKTDLVVDKLPQWSQIVKDTVNLKRENNV